MKIQLLNYRFTFKELKIDEKNVCKRIRFSAIAILQKAPFTASSENVPNSGCSAHGRNYYYFCQIKRLKCSY